ncbi:MULTISPECIES: low molecular weight protein-tyrosine-phosphatase [unclassified Arthrobacter]|uniref:low molecular weight protein-tyrosine-phosphatase n=1 Tax=unclassified Arthrobacter TaxID=235627 RepID=UPI00159E1209|nr:MULTISPECIES: low molecular weight protein-tyrosine-phosphatase [unclassified Arthrobacter]MCQ9164783.1 low molecular weight phosphotyrosine protein phosphatase [Arthrobacter sp. STN4]NVM98769.1 low molecular weight phosphotyrosine protein phosphatase [Arthrobacter sp. SDTb3-6]
MSNPYRIMTVCTGNICRSPMAEFMLAGAAAEAGLDVVVDSAGTTAWEAGNPMDPRAVATLARHGVAAASHEARMFIPAWFAERDLILALDTDHFKALQALAPSPEAAAKVRMLRSFDPAVAGAPLDAQGIYDPWYGDGSDFEASWELISAAIPGILAHATAHGTTRG